MNNNQVLVEADTDRLVGDGKDNITLTIDRSGTLCRYRMDGQRYIDMVKAKAVLPWPCSLR